MEYKKLYISPIESIIPLADSDIPALEYIPPMAKRRYSVITKLSIEIVHRLSQKYDCTKFKQIYSTSTGEINKSTCFTSQYDKDKEISPSLFSMSIINATMALTSISFNLQAGYSVMECNMNDFFTILQAAYSAIYADNQEQILIIYADEEAQHKYSDRIPESKAFGFILSKNKLPDFKELLITDFKGMTISEIINKINYPCPLCTIA